MNKINLIGKQFGRWTVLCRIGVTKNGTICYLCRCKCGKEKVVDGSSLRRGQTKSCGCLQKEISTKHGYSESTTYHAWKNMNYRCNNPNNKRYKDYGKRKIKVCWEWSDKNPKGFKNFLKDIGEIPKNKTIDRINNDKGYYKRNCKLSTNKQQSRNRRNNRLENFNKKFQCRSALAEKYKINRSTLDYRLKKGMSIEEALTIPVRKNKKEIDPQINKIRRWHRSVINSFRET